MRRGHVYSHTSGGEATPVPTETNGKNLGVGFE